MPRTLFNVSNRLPVTLGEDKITKSSGGLVAALEGLSSDDYEAKWIGWPGGAVAPERQPEVECQLRDEHGCIPVFLTEEEEAAHYEGFSNSSVWPLLHYMPTYLRYEPGWWEIYRAVNQRFADKVVELASDDDLVWVHDYQLLLVPAMLRKAKPTLRVGFFLHTPFPACDVFRCHPRRGELIAGMLGANLLGFHTFGYLRHFRSTAAQLLGVETEITRIHAPDGRRPLLGVYPIGINAAKFDQTLDSPDHAARKEKFRATFQGKQLVLSVERMDYTKGILHRIEAVDDYLAGLEDRDRVKFMFVSVPSREGVEEYQELVEDVESRIGRLNGKYATLHNSPIHFIHGSVDFGDLCALYAIADAAIVTPLIDGMNLVAKEFLACQRDHAAPLILSEFAGAAEELVGAIIVNPYDASSVAGSIAQALAMSNDEKRSRTEPMRARVMEYNAGRWARGFIEELAATVPAPPYNLEDSPDRLVEAKTRVIHALHSGQRVAMFLDYDGTLRETQGDPATALPTEELRTLLAALAGTKNLTVTVISGRIPNDLEAFLGAFPFALIAEHGASLRPAGSNVWEALDPQVDYSWKSLVRPVLKSYEEATPGSWTEEKRTSFVWHYRRVDPEFGAWKANQLAETLGAMTANAPVVVRHGHKIVEVVSSHISKGAAARRILKELPAPERPTLVLCAGDDVTDESLFTLEWSNVVGIKVGEGASAADYRTVDPSALRTFLRGCITGEPK